MVGSLCSGERAGGVDVHAKFPCAQMQMKEWIYALLMQWDWI